MNFRKMIKLKKAIDIVFFFFTEYLIYIINTARFVVLFFEYHFFLFLKPNWRKFLPFVIILFVHFFNYTVKFTLEFLIDNLTQI